MDKLKDIERVIRLINGSRHENTAEHSWHLALMTILLAEYSNKKIDVLKTLKMIIVHDIIEIDAGDTFIYDEAGNKTKADREEKAAQRLFHILPDDQAKEFHNVWKEFEDRKTPEAQFAHSIDRLQPNMMNFYSAESVWKSHNLTKSQVTSKAKIIEDGSKELWKQAQKFIDEGMKKGLLRENSNNN